MAACRPRTQVRLATGAVLDLSGIGQTVASLADNRRRGQRHGDQQQRLAGRSHLAPAGGSATFSGVIQDGGSQMALTLDGSGTQVLAGSSTYSGLTTITAGTLQLGSGGATGSINGTSGVVDNGVLAFNRAGTVAFAKNISGSGGVTQMGPGLLQLAGLNNYTGPTCVSGGTLQDIARGAILHFNMAGSGSIANGTTIPDLGGYGNNGTMVGGAASYVSGQFGHGINFNGSYINVPYSASLNVNTWTSSVWINVNPAAADCEILDARTSPTNAYGCDEYYNPGTGSFLTELTAIRNGDVMYVY